MEFRLPDIGEGVTEGEIVRWLVAVGDSVDEDQAVAEVMTDKATVTIASPVTGTVLSIKAEEGSSVEIGGLLLVFQDNGVSPTLAPASAPASASAPAPAARGRVEFRLPDIGEGVTEGEIVRWLVAVGDSVDEEQAVAEVMTDKATVTITAPVSATVLSIEAAEGASIEVGTVMLVFSGEGPASAPRARPAAGAMSAGKPAAPALPPGQRPRILATPATRGKARELGVDITLIRGTGAHGRITIEDVLNEHSRSRREASRPASAIAPVKAPLKGAPKAAAGSGDTHVPIRGIRKKIAQAMSLSCKMAAHFSYVEEVNVTELCAFREELKPIAAAQGARLTFLPFIVRATVAALKDPRFHKFNANIDDENDVLIMRGECNIGIATDTEQGLIVPVLKEADRLSMLEVAQEIARLSAAAKDRKLSVAELRGGTFTITSAGSIGGLFATPIINYPEVAILGVHKIKERPIIKDGEITKGQIMYLSLSLDHRVIDGADAAHFMNKVISYLENPKRLLLE
jgi:pyruvate dehydrogenase E2 component (dihydrolipoamide acetyltransferase)